MDVSQRFWSKVNKTDTCWLWTAGVFKKGYGAFRYEGKTAYAHRVSWEWENGPIPEGSVIDHMCHTRNCVRPSHLRLVSVKENNQNRKGADRRGSTGLRGAHREGNRFVANVKTDGKIHRVGVFDTAEEAAEAARVRREELFGPDPRL